MTVKDWLREHCRAAGMPDPDAESGLECCGQVVLKKGGGRSMKAGGAWIYDNEIDRAEPCPDGGAGCMETGGAGSSGFWILTDIFWAGDASTPCRRSVCGCLRAMQGRVLLPLFYGEGCGMPGGIGRR